MKNYFLLLFSAFLLFSCSDNKVIKEPEEIGFKVFEMLKNMNTLKQEEFISNLVTLEEIHELGTREDLIPDSKTRSNYKRFKKENLDRVNRGDYLNLKKNGKKKEIDWATIKNEGFEIESLEKDDVKLCVGYLQFSHNESLYKIEVNSMFTGKGYSLIRIHRFRTL